MTKLVLIALLGLFLVASEAAANQGERIFNSQGCIHCYKLAVSKIGPSLKEMAQAYEGKEGRLFSYLKGEAEPIIEQAKASMMKRPLEKTKSLSDEEIKAMADFVMSYKD